MIGSFFGYTGHVPSVPLEDRRNVNAKWHATIYLLPVFDGIQKYNKKRRNILQPAKHVKLVTIQRRKTSNYYLIIFSCSPLPSTRCPDSYFYHLKKQLKTFKTMFLRYNSRIIPPKLLVGTRNRYSRIISEPKNNFNSINMSEITNSL